MEGLTVDKIHSNRTSLTCLTRHLTSFAVLVSIQDEKPVRIKELNYHLDIIHKFSHQKLMKHCQ